MKILEVNSVPYGSTGQIMFSISDNLRSIGNDVLCTTGFTWTGCQRTDWFQTSNIIEKSIHILLSRFTGRNECYSYFATYRLIYNLKNFSPDIIHLHNLHGWYLNLPLFFSYIKKNNIPIIWTLHDCWSFTGQCPHFTMVKCNKWKTGCHHCPQYHEYPATYVDRTKTMWKLKKKWFTCIQNMTIITPSQWLAGLVKQSYLKEYPVKVINNGIDLRVFKPTPSDFREKYDLNGKYIVLGVAFGWGKRKGLDVFIELSKHLDNTKYQIVLVGTDDQTDKQLPEKIISIHRTHDQHELVQIYSAADVFANPTREEVLGLVNIESLACGTPVVTFCTGGSPEVLNEFCGSVVPCEDTDALYHEIIRICETKPFSKEACLKRAQDFDMNNTYSEYIKLYKGLANEK